MGILNKINHKVKFIALVISVFLFSMVVYILAIKSTLDLRKENIDYKNNINIAVSAPEEIEKLQNQLNRLNKDICIISDEIDFNKILINEVGIGCHQFNVRLLDFKKPNYYLSKDLTLITYNIEIEGEFKNIVQVIRYLEKKLTMGRVASVRYYIKHDIQAKREFLVANMFVQSFKNGSNEI